MTACSESAGGVRNGWDALDVEKQRAGNTTRQPGRARAQDTTPKTKRKSRKHRSKKRGTTTPDRTQNSKNRPRQRPKIDFGAILGGLRRSGSFNGRRRTRPRPPKNAPRRARGGPRALLAAPGRPKTRPNTRSDRPWDAPVARGGGDGARSQRRTLARAFGTRILIVFRVSRDSADVRSVPFFTVFCCLRTK